MRIAIAGLLTATLILVSAAAAMIPDPAHAQSAVSFKPPTRGAPSRRIGGATRSGDTDMQLAVIAPASLSYTATPSPVLFLSINGFAERTILTLIADEAIDPLFEREMTFDADGGLQAISLAALDVRLEEGVVYEWSVAIITNPDSRSEDVVSSGTIRYEPSSTDRSDIRSLAESGYWYDLIEALLGPDGRGVDAESMKVFENLAAEAGLPLPAH